MSEWCLDCWNKDKDKDERELTIDVVTLSTDLHLCEGCGELKKVIIEIETVSTEKLRHMGRKPKIIIKSEGENNPLYTKKCYESLRSALNEWVKK